MIKFIEYFIPIVFLIAGVLIISILINLLNKVLNVSLNKTLTKTNISLEKDAYCNAEVQRIIIRLKLELHSCKVILSRFHNGGCYANGLDMKKFTVSHETTGGTIGGINLMDKCVGVLNSRYGIAFETLAASHQFVVNDTDECLDQNFKNDMISYGFKACYLFLIKQVNGVDEGFIGINFKETIVLTAEQRDIVKDQIPRILNLINMKENRFN